MLEVERNLYVFRRWWWLLVAAALIGGLLAFGLTKVLVKQQYQAIATIAMAPPPQGGQNGLYVTSLAATADAELIPSLSTATLASRAVPGTSPQDLLDKITSAASLDDQLLFVYVTWPDQKRASRLANATALAFITQEQTRLEHRYRIIHASLTAEEAHLTSLLRTTGGAGAARDWLKAQYADAASNVYQQDAQARAQTTTQKASLQLARPAQTAARVGPKATVNGLLGAVLAFLLALVFAYLATTYERPEEEAMRPVLTKVGE